MALSGVTVLLTTGGGGQVTAVTDGSGNFTIPNIPNGTYLITPSLVGYIFTPTSLNVTVAGSNLSLGSSFTSTAIGSIAGSISGVTGVTMTLTGAAATASTISTTTYAFGSLAPGSYTVTPTKTGYSFSPPSISITIVGTSPVITGQNFTGTGILSISGNVSGATTVAVALTGISTGFTTTDGSGNFIFPNLTPGTYTITPSQTGFTISPINRSIAVVSTNATGASFTATSTAGTLTISGSVSGATAVAVALSGSAPASGTTDGSGNFSFTGLAAGSYTVTPTKTGYAISPLSDNITLTTSNSTGNTFTATATSGTLVISGNVSGASSVGVTLSGSAGAFATTDGSGNYSFTGLPAGSFTITPILAGYSISPPSDSFTLTTSNSIGNNFTATAVTSLASQIHNDMVGVNEGHPHGVPSGFDFYTSWFIGIGNDFSTTAYPPSGVGALEYWLGLYVGPSGNPASNTWVNFKNAGIYILSTSNVWTSHVFTAADQSGQYYAEDFSAGGALIDIRTETDGSWSYGTTSGSVGHSYAPYPRVAVASTVNGIISIVDARLILDNPLGTDDRATASYLLECGCDPYATTTSDGIEHNPAIGGGNFKFVTTAWRSFAMTTCTLAQLNSFPPPISLTGINP
jgi:hypothetical protein